MMVVVGRFDEELRHFAARGSHLFDETGLPRDRNSLVCLVGYHERSQQEILRCPRNILTRIKKRSSGVRILDGRGREGRYEALAIADYDKAIGLNPKNGAAFNNRAATLASLRQYDRAIKDYDEAIRLDPENGLYIKNRGNAFRMTGQYAQAIAAYRKALTLKIDEPVRKQIETVLKELGLAGRAAEPTSADK
jgi:tetratricopeptide (TPR) repeat protein